MNRFVFLILFICGCSATKTERVSYSNQASAVREAIRTRVLAPPPVPSPVHLTVVNEWPLTNMEIVTQAQRIAHDGTLHVALYDDKIRLWRTGPDNCELILTNWLTRFGNAAAGLRNNILVVAGIGANFGPLILQEYVLTDWNNGFPSRAVFITERNWSTWEGRDIRILVTDIGGFFVATCRHTGGWQNDIAYRSPAGIWSTSYYEYAPNDFIPSFQLEVGQTSDHSIRICMNKDSSGKIMQATFVERDNDIAFKSFGEFLGSEDGEMSPDPEIPGMYSCNEDGVFEISCKTVWGSEPGCDTRLAYPFIAEFEILPPPSVKPDIISKSLVIDFQNVSFRFWSVPDQRYVPKVSTDLSTWLSIKPHPTGNFSTPTQTYFKGFNPFYSESIPFTNLFFTVEAVNWRPRLVYRVPTFTERSWPPLKLFRSNGVLHYLISPLSPPDCLVGVWNRDGDPTPLDFDIMIMGSDGWAIIRRADGFYLRKI